MNLEQLKKIGTVCQDKVLFKRSITDENGDEVEFEFFVRRVSFADYMTLAEAGKSGKQQNAMIHACIRLGDGDEIIPMDVIDSLSAELGIIFVLAIHEVMNPSKADPKT